MHLLFQTTRPLGPETGTGDDDDVGPMGQAIQTCRGQQGGSEQVGPLLQSAVTGEHNATPLVPLVDDVVEVLGGRRVQELVEYYQRRGSWEGVESLLSEGVYFSPDGRGIRLGATLTEIGLEEKERQTARCPAC